MSGRAARSAGFTLIEVLLATALLAAGLAIAFSTLTAATRTATQGEAMARHNDRLRTVEDFLRRRLAAARPMAFAMDAGRQVPLRFAGEAGRMRFVADVPAYLGRGGPYLHDVRIVADGDGDGVGIELSLSMVLAGRAIAESPPRPPEVLVEGLQSARFRYRGLGPDGDLAGWQSDWTDGARLPLLVEIRMTDADGRQWPPLVVGLPMADPGAAGAGNR